MVECLALQAYSHSEDSIASNTPCKHNFLHRFQHLNAMIYVRVPQLTSIIIPNEALYKRDKDFLKYCVSPSGKLSTILFLNIQLKNTIFVPRRNN